MEYSFSQIKKMDVVCVNDGKNMGRVCDIVFLIPKNEIKGFYVTGGRGFRLTRSDVFIPICDLVKIGEDVILVNGGKKKGEGKDDCSKPRPPQNCCPPCPPPRRNFDEYE